MKSTPIRGVKEFLKPVAFKRSEHPLDVTACLFIMNLRVAMACEVKPLCGVIRSESEAEEAV